MDKLMAINRRFLYVGLFLVALGGVLVAIDLAAIDSPTLGNALRLWPLALIAIGAGIVFRRSRYALVAGVLAAMMPGLVVGGGLAVAPRYSVDCAERGELVQTASRSGTFSAPAVVSVTTSCGSVRVSTVPGNVWQLTAASDAGRTPDVSGADDWLTIRSTGHEGWDWLDEGRDSWDLALPTSQIEQLNVAVNAGSANIALPDARIGTLSAGANGAEIVVDASRASLTELNGAVRFGLLSIHLPSGDLSGAIRIDAGQLELCAPPGVGLHVDIAGSAREVHVAGLRYEGRAWESDGYALAGARADLSVKVNFGAIEINPIGGCK
jgi:hypothetical protein